MSGFGRLSNPNRIPNPPTTSQGWNACKLWACVFAASSVFALGAASTAVGSGGYASTPSVPVTTPHNSAQGHHKLVRPKRHQKPHRRNTHGVGDASPEFTG
jgi:hypothetical protein